ncbi:hypothetical protein J4219_05645 [Candidatus Woesearchaeota archaeon]|nr:hypothetical protein [Candidatus Woesearchaeota archaeon]
MQNNWKALQNNFELPESQLRAALCRIVHFENGEVKDLRGPEQEVHSYLAEKGLQAHQVYRLASHRKSSYGIRYAELRAQDKWRLMLELKQRLGVMLPEKSPLEIRKTVRRIGRFYYGEIKDLTEEEQVVEDLLQKYGIKAPTLYQWLLQTLVPEELKDRMEKGEVSGIQAIRAMQNRERQRKAAVGLTLLEGARSLVKEVFL